MGIVQFGFLMCGPPCSLFIFLSAPVHKRSASQPWGDLAKPNIRRANTIMSNLAIILAIAHERFVFIGMLSFDLAFWGGNQEIQNPRPGGHCARGSKPRNPRSLDRALKWALYLGSSLHLLDHHGPSWTLMGPPSSTLPAPPSHGLIVLACLIPCGCSSI
jgi:hypothetical protein